VWNELNRRSIIFDLLKLLEFSPHLEKKPERFCWQALRGIKLQHDFTLIHLSLSWVSQSNSLNHKCQMSGCLKFASGLAEFRGQFVGLLWDFELINHIWVYNELPHNWNLLYHAHCLEKIFGLQSKSIVTVRIFASSLNKALTTRNVSCIWTELSCPAQILGQEIINVSELVFVSYISAKTSI